MRCRVRGAVIAVGWMDAREEHAAVIVAAKHACILLLSYAQTAAASREEAV